MAPNTIPGLRYPTWVWAAVEVGLGGKNQNCVFRIMRQPSEALDGTTRGTAELTRLAFTHVGCGNMVTADGWAATRAIEWAPPASKHTLIINLLEFILCNY